MNNITTIKLTKDTKNRLSNVKAEGETFESLIKRLLEEKTNAK